MIRSNRFKLLVAAAVSTALLAVVPAMTQARSHYTGKTPAAVTDLSMAAVGPIIPPADFIPPVKKTKKVTAHTTTKKAAVTAVKHKHKKHKKHKKTA